MQFLSDPLWAGIFGAIIATIISVFLTSLFYKRLISFSQSQQQDQKEFSLDIITNTPILSPEVEEKGEIEILIENKPIKHTRLIILKLSNLENDLLLPKDYVTFSYKEILAIQTTNRNAITVKVPQADIFQFFEANQSLRQVQRYTDERLDGKSVLIVYDTNKVVVKPISWTEYIIKGYTQEIELKMILVGTESNIEVMASARGQNRKLEDIQLIESNIDGKSSKGEE